MGKLAHQNPPLPHSPALIVAGSLESKCHGRGMSPSRSSLQRVACSSGTVLSARGATQSEFEESDLLCNLIIHPSLCKVSGSCNGLGAKILEEWLHNLRHPCETRFEVGSSRVSPYLNVYSVLQVSWFALIAVHWLVRKPAVLADDVLMMCLLTVPTRT